MCEHPLLTNSRSTDEQRPGRLGRIGNWLSLALLVLMRWRRPALVMLWGGLMVLGLLGFQAIPDALLRPEHY